jgi:hypothetical protein
MRQFAHGPQAEAAPVDLLEIWLGGMLSRTDGRLTMADT